MRLTVALLFAGVAAASPSLIARQEVPQCTLTCIASANLGGCASTDNVCLCKSDVFIDDLESCVDSTCYGEDLAEAKAFVDATCEAVGVALPAAWAP